MGGQMKVLDLGSGKFPYKPKENEKVIRLDISPEVKPDVVWDLRKIPLPFKKNEFDLIVAHNILEHFTDDQYENIIEELWRICKPDGVIDILVPYFSHPGAWENVGRFGHKIRFAYNTFWRYRIGDFEEYTRKVHFKILKQRYENSLLAPLFSSHWLIAMGYQRLFCWIYPMQHLRIYLQPDGK